MFRFETQPSRNPLESFLEGLIRGPMFNTLDKFGQEGVEALAKATPVESGETASSWSYEIVKDAKSYSIIWKNSHVEDGIPVVILLQYGHGTGTGGYVEGRDFINPAIQPIFDRIAEEAWKAVRA